MFETRAAQTRGWRNKPSDSYYSKAAYASDIEASYNETNAVQIVTNPQNTPITKTSLLIRSSYRSTSSLNLSQLKAMENLTEIKEASRLINLHINLIN